MRQLVNEFLKAKRAERGAQTAANYRARLRPVLDFADRPDQMARWPLASSVDAEFVASLHTFLMTYETSRNGRQSAARRVMSSTQARHVLETLRCVYNWALDPLTARLPGTMLNPFRRGSIPHKPQKNPLRDDFMPLDLRVRLVSHMDEWQLCQLGWSLVLPLRPDEVEGLLITDVNTDKRRLEFGQRFTDSNFTKEKTRFVLPYPPEFDALLARCVQGRRAGPLLRSRRSFGRPERSDCESEDALREAYEAALLEAGGNRVQAEHDRKLIFRDVLRNRWGGVSKDRLTVEFKQLVRAVTGREDWTLYDLRHAATQGMKDAKLPLLELRYLTGHACNDIMNEYASIDPEAIRAYFAAVQPLIDAIAARGEQLGLRAG